MSFLKRMTQHKAYLTTVLKHKAYVFYAGLKLGGIPVWRLLVHDVSKFYPVEYFGYRANFNPVDEAEKESNKKDWDRAWGHHWQSNPHHWQYFTNEEQKASAGGLQTIVHTKEMPEVDVREMVADWMAAGRVYSKTGSWDITDWFMANYPKMWLDDKTVPKLDRALKDIFVSFSSELQKRRRKNPPG